MDRYLSFPHRYCEYLSGYEKYHAYLCPEPWSRRRVVVTWLVIALFVVASAAAAVSVRNSNERYWCGQAELPSSQPCRAEQKAIRCGPLGVLHCPNSPD